MYKYYNPTHLSHDVNGCVARAFSCAFDNKTENNYNMRITWRKDLIDNGFKFVDIPAKPFKKRMTVRELSEKSKYKDVIICSVGDHVVCIKHNNYYDITDTGDRCVFYYLVKGE